MHIEFESSHEQQKFQDWLEDRGAEFDQSGWELIVYNADPEVRYKAQDFGGIITREDY